MRIHVTDRHVMTLYHASWNVQL